MPPWEGARFSEETGIMQCNVWGECGISRAEMCEAAELPFGLMSGEWWGGPRCGQTGVDIGTT